MWIKPAAGWENWASNQLGDMQFRRKLYRKADSTLCCNLAEGDGTQSGGFAAPTYPDAPGERTQLVGGGLNDVDARKRHHFGRLPLDRRDQRSDLTQDEVKPTRL
jgi:hypothetical protein